LDQLVLRIGSIVQYEPQYFNFNSPANPVAAAWAHANLRLFPLGHCKFRDAAEAQVAVQWTDLN
jgi:hypothetical protein